MWVRIWALLDWCFFGPASARAGMLGGSLRVLRYPYAVVRDLGRGEINLRAMSLVYTTLLSIIPLVAFSLAILKIVGNRRDLEPIVYELFRPLGDAAASELATRIVQFAGHVSGGVVGSVGLALLAWTLLGTIKKIEDSFNFLWHVDQPRSLARRLAEYTSLIIAGPVPRRRCSSGRMFTALVVYSTRLTIVYAGFAFVVAALLWTYFGWLILLAGAQLSFYVQNPTYLRLGLQQLRLSGVELEHLALKLMYLVARTHVAGGRRWSVNRLAAELTLPGIAVAQMAATLEEAGLLIVTDDDELVPARDISRIDVHQILDIARNQSSGHVAPRHVPLPPVDRLLAGIDEARRQRCAALTLRDLVDEGARPALHLTARQSSSA